MKVIDDSYILLSLKFTRHFFTPTNTVWQFTSLGVPGIWKATAVTPGGETGFGPEILKP